MYLGPSTPFVQPLHFIKWFWLPLNPSDNFILLPILNSSISNTQLSDNGPLIKIRVSKYLNLYNPI
jgi:hypothetical protein